MEKVIGCHCHECVPLCKNLSYHTGGRDSPCRLEEMSGLLKKFLWQRTVGGLQLTSSKKLGSSVMQLQRNGFFQQPEWTRKQILPQSSFQMRTQPRQHLNCSLVRPWAENPCEPCTCSSPTETEAIVWIVLSCWVYGDLLYSSKKIYTIPDPFVICKGFVSTFATFSSCPPPATSCHGWGGWSWDQRTWEAWLWIPLPSFPHHLQTYPDLFPSSFLFSTPGPVLPTVAGLNLPRSPQDLVIPSHPYLVSYYPSTCFLVSP